MKRYFPLMLASAAIVLASAGTAVAEGKGDASRSDYHKKFMEKIDTDKDGNISKAEHMAAAEKRFEKMDANGDGVISKEERKAMHDKMKERFKEHRGKRHHPAGEDE